MELLPTEIISKILNTVSDKDVLHFGATCKRFRAISTHKLKEKKSFDESTEYLLNLAISRPELYNYIATSKYNKRQQDSRKQVLYAIVPVDVELHLFVSYNTTIESTTSRIEIIEDLSIHQNYNVTHFPHILNNFNNKEEMNKKKVIEYTTFCYEVYNSIHWLDAMCLVFDGIRTPVFIDNLYGDLDHFICRTYNFLLQSNLANKYFSSVLTPIMKRRSCFFSLMTFDNMLSDMRVMKNKCIWEIGPKHGIRKPKRKFILSNKGAIRTLQDNEISEISTLITKRPKYKLWDIELHLLCKEDNFKIGL
jgi:hypothetical protein